LFRTDAELLSYHAKRLFCIHYRSCFQVRFGFFIYCLEEVHLLFLWAVTSALTILLLLEYKLVLFISRTGIEVECLVWHISTHGREKVREQAFQIGLFPLADNLRFVDGPSKLILLINNIIILHEGLIVPEDCIGILAHYTLHELGLR
jgi:hypothetical protein